MSVAGLRRVKLEVVDDEHQSKRWRRQARE
jgi:hypothetical protein